MSSLWNMESYFHSPGSWKYGYETIHADSYDMSKQTIEGKCCGIIKKIGEIAFEKVQASPITWMRLLFTQL